MLRAWRRARRRSQLALALDAGVSQRHLSFIETGRSMPSEATLLGIAEALAVPLRDRNALLLAAGYGPRYAAEPLDPATLAGVTVAIRRMLDQHDPFPAFVLDRDWTVLDANDAARRFLGRFVDLAAFPRPRNILHLMFDPRALRPFVDDWPAVARSLIGRVCREAVGGVPDDHALALLAALRRHGGLDPAWANAVDTPAAPGPVTPIGFRRGDGVLRYFSLVTIVGAPRTVAAEGLRLECMFPIDAETERRHRAMMNEGERSL